MNCTKILKERILVKEMKVQLHQYKVLEEAQSPRGTDQIVQGVARPGREERWQRDAGILFWSDGYVHCPTCDDFTRMCGKLHALNTCSLLEISYISVKLKTKSAGCAVRKPCGERIRTGPTSEGGCEDCGFQYWYRD